MAYWVVYHSTLDSGSGSSGLGLLPGLCITLRFSHHRIRIAMLYKEQSLSANSTGQSVNHLATTIGL